MSGPSVVAFSGHRIDAAERSEPRFPAAAERAVYERILEALTAWKTVAGFSSAADGSDILFLEALGEMGAETNIVLPHPPDAFIKTSVSQDPRGDWVARFAKALERAREVTVLSNQVGDAPGYQFASIVVAGMAGKRAAELHGSLRALVVWDLQRGAAGGTGAAASDWLRRRIPVERISPLAQDGGRQLLDTGHCISYGDVLDADQQRLISQLFAEGGSSGVRR